MTLTNYKKRIFTSILLLLILILIFKFDFILIYSLIIFSTFSVIEFLNISKKIFNNKINLFLINFFFIIYLFIFCILFVYISNIAQLKILLFSLLVCCIGSDIGGYIFGKIFKGPKLTSISPKKTISGAIGSIVFSTLFFCSLIFAFINQFNYKFLTVAIITSIFCQIGDLLFSLLKRKAKLKDTGNILPGHGGVLDRLDGILLGIPIGFISIFLFY